MIGSKREDGSFDYLWYPEDGGRYQEAASEAALHAILREGEGGITAYTLTWYGDDFEVHTLADQINLLNALEDVGLAIQNAREEEEAAMAKLVELLPTAIANGISEVRAAKMTNLDRGTIRRALGK
jgi:hypothetical protein